MTTPGGSRAGEKESGPEKLARGKEERGGRRVQFFKRLYQPDHNVVFSNSSPLSSRFKNHPVNEDPHLISSFFHSACFSRSCKLSTLSLRNSITPLGNIARRVYQPEGTRRVFVLFIVGKIEKRSKKERSRTKNWRFRGMSANWRSRDANWRKAGDFSQLIR